MTEEQTTGDQQLAEAMAHYEQHHSLLTWGHKPQLPGPRKSGISKVSREIGPSEWIRVRYFDYYEQKNILAFVRVEACIDALAPFGGACQIGDEGRLRYMYVRCPDDSIRWVSPSWPQEVEIRERHSQDSEQGVAQEEEMEGNYTEGWPDD